MDMNLLYAILIALVPVVITIILSKVYNIFHGLISFLVTGFVLFFCIEAFQANLPAELLVYLQPNNESLFSVCGLYYAINELLVSGLSSIGLASFFEWVGHPYVVLGAFVLVFVVSQVLSSVVRKRRIEKERNMKRQLKRY